VKTKAIVFEEAASSQPVRLDQEAGQQRRNVVPPKYSLFFRHGLARRLRKLRDMYFVVIVLQRDCSRGRQRQIVRSMQAHDIHFDAVY
jgi:hypothetical protein